MYKHMMLGMMTQASISGTLSYLGMIKLSTGQQLGAAVFYVVLVVIIWGHRERRTTTQHRRGAHDGDDLGTN